MNTSISHPLKRMISADEMSAVIAGGNHLVTRKYDGEFSTVQIAGCTIIAERMRGEISGHHYTAQDRATFARGASEWFAALTVAEMNGERALDRPAHQRHHKLLQLAQYFPPNVILAENVSDVDAAMLAGAEGVCAVAWDSPYGEMLCHKAEGIWTCRVTKTGRTQSVGICDAATGADLGNVALRGGKSDQIRVGSIIRVAGMGLTDAGKIRQPNPCSNWLVAV